MTRAELKTLLTRACDAANTPHPERRYLIALASDPNVTTLARGAYVRAEGTGTCHCPIMLVAESRGWDHLLGANRWPAFARDFAIEFDVVTASAGYDDVKIIHLSD